MKEYRPGYHYLPKRNWINDPCGLIHHNGIYHLFYQYNPYGDTWGNMHWGHAISKDMVDWSEQEIAMYPDKEHGEEHCFTGCGYKLPNGRAAFFYTSISDDRAPEQWLALPDDEQFSHISQLQQHAMRLSMHPEGMEISEWRDPCISSYKDGYLMVLGCRLGDHGGCLLYTSKDGMSFEYRSILAEADGSEDYSWECPNFFPMGDKYVLFYSPYRQVHYIVGYLTDELVFVPESKGVLDDSGHEGQYAPQAFRDENGRILLINWLTERSRGSYDGIKGWAGCHSLPKEMYLEQGIVKMRVIGEVEKLAQSHETFGGSLLVADAGEQYRLVLDGRLEQDGCVTVEAYAAPDGSEKTVIRVHGNGRMVVDRGLSSKHPTHHSLLEKRITLYDGRLHLEIYVDHSVLEVSGNNEWLSTRVYPQSEAAVGLKVTTLDGEINAVLSRMRDCQK